MRTPAAFLTGALAFAAAASLPAQTAPRYDLTPVLQSTPAPEPATPNNRPRLLSPETASKIAVDRPAFVPKAQTQETARAPDLRETDKPRNGIIRLPPHMVQGLKMPILKERDILTPYGKLQEAYKRYPGLRFGSLPFFSNNGVAMAMLEDEFRLERIAEMNDLMGLMSFNDPREAKVLMKGAARGFLRSGEWISSGGSHALQRAGAPGGPGLSAK